MRRASTDVAQRAAGYFALWWHGRKLVFESRYQADGLVLTVFLRGVCVGAPYFSGREVAHLRLQAQAPHPSIGMIMSPCLPAIVIR
jgi:hypothetical protein